MSDLNIVTKLMILPIAQGFLLFIASLHVIVEKKVNSGIFWVNMIDFIFFQGFLKYYLWWLILYVHLATQWYTNIWSNIILGVSVKGFFSDEIMSKVDCPL